MINREDFEEMEQWASEQTGWLDQTEIKGFFSVYEDEHRIERKASCGECKHSYYNKEFGIETEDLMCKKYRAILGDNGYFRNEYIKISKGFFCADFERKEQ